MNVVMNVILRYKQEKKKYRYKTGKIAFPTSFEVGSSFWKNPLADKRFDTRAT